MAKTSQSLSIDDDENSIKQVKRLNKQYEIPCRKIVAIDMIPLTVIQTISIFYRKII